MATPRILNRVAILAMVIPCSIWVGAEALMRLIPGCKVQMYGENECFVGTFNLAGPLLIAGIGGVSLFVLLSVFVALPLFVIAAVLSRRAKRKASAA
jgi:hypothetical protein